MGILTLAESAAKACEVFRTFVSGEPDLVPTGLPAVDQVITGLFPGSAGVVGAGTGVGKSSLALQALLTACRKVPAGLISLEDTPDVLGSRAISVVSGVSSLKLRNKTLLTDTEKQRVAAAIETLRSYPVTAYYAIGGSIEQCEHGIEMLAGQGCRLIWVDYIQKIRGGSADRRNEVANGFARIQARAAQVDAAVMVVSQVKRLMDPKKMPTRWDLKETGDLENEARLIVMLRRDDATGLLHGVVDKSTVGGEGRMFTMRRNDVGVLEYVNEEDEEWT